MVIRRLGGRSGGRRFKRLGANQTMADTLLKLLRDVLDEVHSLVPAVHFSATNRQHLLSGALLGRILEIAEGIYSTLERQDSACGFILLRSLLEVHMDLRILEKDPGHDEVMHAAWLSQQKSMLEKAVEKGSVSPFLRSIAGEAGAKELLDEVRAQLLELKDRKIRPLSIKEKFEKAGLLDYYDGPYNDLSWNTHSNINVLEKRHIKLKSGGFEIRAFDPISDVELKIISDTAAGFVANSLVAATNVAAEGAEACDLSNLTEKLGRFRAALRD
jgi:hypothetical protein